MVMQLGHIQCYFSPTNQYSSDNLAEIKEMIMAYLIKGWKVALEYNDNTRYYTICWGA